MTLYEKLLAEAEERLSAIRESARHRAISTHDACRPAPVPFHERHAPDPEGEAKDEAAGYVAMLQEVEQFGYITLPNGDRVEPDSERSPLRRAGLI